MNDEQIQKYLNDLTVSALAKGLGQPTFRIEIQDNRNPLGYLRYDLSEAGAYKSEFVYGNSILDILQQMSLHIRTLKSKEDREHEEYLKKVAAAVEYGRKINIDQALINPLLEQMKKLSSNIIEHKPELPTEREAYNDYTENKEPQRPSHFNDDEIPF